ncbi:MAG: hypothetical protein RLZZ93_272 [Actinomycetota bacterium]
MVISAGAPAASSAAETASSSAVLDTFGMTTADTHAFAAAATSSLPHGVSRALQRMVSSRLPYSPLFAAATACARAVSFASGDTASSRSKMMASAGMPFAFSSARSLAAGM